MSGLGYALVIFSAILHAGWNAVLRGGQDRAWSAGWMAIATCLFSLPWLPFVGVPAAAAWPYLLISAVLHNVYLELLVVAYRTGDLSAAYPIARGSSPVLVCLGAWLAAGETLSPLNAAGVLLVSGGILSIARDRGRIDRQTLLASLATGVCIATYTVLDGLGVRHTSLPFAYNAWQFVIYGGMMGARFLYRLGWRAAVAPTGDPIQNRKFIAAACAGGVVSVCAYALVTIAMQHSQLGLVSALRETSVVFAALIGRFILREPLPFRRAVACVAIAAGAVFLAR